MKQVFTIIITLLFFSSVFAQNKHADNLKKELKTARGNARIDLLNQIASGYMEKRVTTVTTDVNGKIISREVSVDYPDIEEAKKYIDNAMELSKANNYDDGLAVSHYFKAKYYFQKNNEKKAKKEHQNWMEVRKNQNDFKKIRWAYFNSIEYFISVKEFELALKLYDELDEIASIQSLKPYEQLDLLVSQHYILYDFKDYEKEKIGHKKIAVLEKKTILLLNYRSLITTTPYVTLDYFFSTQIESALRKNELQKASRLGSDWLISLERVADKDKQYATARFIARYFYDKSPDNEDAKLFMSKFLKKSIAYAIRKGDVQKIKDAHYNACYCIRRTGQKLEALELMIGAKAYFLNENRDADRNYISALEACGNLLYYDNAVERKEAILLLENWKTKLSTYYDKSLINFCNDYIRQFSR